MKHQPRISGFLTYLQQLRFSGCSVIVLALAVALFVTCGNPVQNTATTPSDVDAHSLTLTWNPSAVGKKTIVPASYPLPVTYDITLHPESGADVMKNDLAATTWTFSDLAAVVYAITVQGKDGDGNVIVTGMASADMGPALPVSSIISLSYVSTGSGTGQLHLTFDLSGAGTIVDSATLTLVNPSGETIVSTLSRVGNSQTFSYSNPSAPAGSWMMFSTFASSAKAAMKLESILVLQNVDTTATVTLSSADFSDIYVPVSGLTVSAPTMALIVGGTPGSLAATLSPSNPSNALVTWTSSAPLVASVDQNGLVTPVAAGTATITVTAVDHPEAAASCAVTVVLNPAKAITAFSFADPAVTGTISEASHAIAVTVPYGTAVTALVPALAITGASVSPASGVALSFGNAVTYTVTAADGTTQAYVVTVTVALNPAKAITAFTFPTSTGTTITEASHVIAVTVPYGTAMTALVPAITITGASVSPASGVARNFTSPVTYTVTAANGTTQAYVVTVTVALNPAKAITAFTFPTSIGTTITEASHVIAVTVPYGTSVISITPTITITGASVNPASGVAQNFSSPGPYWVTAANGTTQVYTVTVTVAPNPAKAITAFTFTTSTGTTIDEASHVVAVTVPYGTAVTALVPAITITGAGVSPASGVARSFTSPATYTVTAADASTQAYVVTVTAADAPLIMVPIPAGTVAMGALVVNLSPFRMSKYDITQSQYMARMGTNPSHFHDNTDAANCPVEQVSWYDAVEFCNKLSSANGLQPVYTIGSYTYPSGNKTATVTATWTNNGYRLPTEAQWEYAARAGSTTTYYWGNASDDATVGQYAWYNQNSGSTTHAVGQKLSNAWGLYDVAGNVMQWVWDWFNAFPSGTRQDWTGPGDGANRVIRNGSYFDTFVSLSSARGSGAYNKPYYIWKSLGFRVVAPPLP